MLALGVEAPPARRPRLEELDLIDAWWEERISSLREECLCHRCRVRDADDRPASR